MILHLSEIDSTNSELRRRLTSEPLDDFSVITADYQSAGRGQVGNHWESQPNMNLLMSILLRPLSLDVRMQYYLSMAVSSAIVRSINSFLPQTRVQIKWPNDIYVGDKKIAGILIENSLRGSFIADSIVGIGLNVNQTIFLSDAPNPISMKNITSTDFKCADIADTIRRNMMLAVDYVNNQMFDSIVKEYLSSLYRFDGQYHSFTDPISGPFEARISNVEPDGHIHLIDSNGTDRRYTFKEVEFVI